MPVKQTNATKKVVETPTPSPSKEELLEEIKQDLGCTNLITTRKPIGKAKAPILFDYWGFDVTFDDGAFMTITDRRNRRKRTIETSKVYGMSYALFFQTFRVK